MGQDLLKVPYRWTVNMGVFSPFHTSGQLTSQSLPKGTELEGARSRWENLCNAPDTIDIKLEICVNLIVIKRVLSFEQPKDGASIHLAYTSHIQIIKQT